ncbi:MAG: DUF418 domain-containing protein [Burkholderiaceae bacterium]|nr:DUF418 domain-containing protein [Burkholderiaceae bacterium]
MSIFAFLFGFGAALQFKALRRRAAVAAPAASVVQALAAYRRRLRFLLAVGIAHGLLLYYGDILTFYALCGFLLAPLLAQRPARLLRLALLMWALAAAIAVGAAAVVEAARDAMEQPDRIPPEVLEAFGTYAAGTYLEQLPQRAADFFNVLMSMLLLALPQVLGLFLLGMLAARLGWLARPQRYRRLWRAATVLGVLALPVAAAGAWLTFSSVVQEPGLPNAAGYAVQFFGTAVACLYVAAFVRLRGRPAVAAVIRWLAPAGRMPLTNYLLQSVAMGALLSGWGLGWGESVSRAQLALLALAIVLVQIAVSRAWIVRFGQGPIEALWRRATYGAQKPR